MNTLDNTVFVSSCPESLTTAVVHALESFTSAAAQIDQIKADFISLLVDPADYSPRNLVISVAPIVAAWYDSKRFDLAQYYGPVEGDGQTWDSFDGFKAIKTGLASFRQKLARECEGWTFQITGRISPCQCLAGSKSKFEITEPKVPVGIKPVTASAKGADTGTNQPKVSPKSEPASPAQVAQDAVETLDGDFQAARSAMLQLLKQFPELTHDSAIKTSFDRNFKKVVSTKAATAKQKAAAKVVAARRAKKAA